MRAEVKVATLLVQHNILLALADELIPLFRDVFPDSQIAKNYSSKCTKTACIINGAIAPYFQQRLVECMRNEPFFKVHVMHGHGHACLVYALKLLNFAMNRALQDQSHS